MTRDRELAIQLVTADLADGIEADVAASRGEPTFRRDISLAWNEIFAEAVRDGVALEVASWLTHFVAELVIANAAAEGRPALEYWSSLAVRVAAPD
jgi:hypothetical protein